MCDFQKIANLFSLSFELKICIYLLKIYNYLFLVGYSKQYINRGEELKGKAKCMSTNLIYL